MFDVGLCDIGMCEHCGSTLEQGSYVCEYCGTDYEDEVDLVDGIETVECPYCWAEVPSNFYRCDSCGTELRE